MARLLSVPLYLPYMFETCMPSTLADQATPGKFSPCQVLVLSLDYPKEETSLFNLLQTLRDVFTATQKIDVVLCYSDAVLEAEDPRIVCCVLAEVMTHSENVFRFDMSKSREEQQSTEINQVFQHMSPDELGYALLLIICNYCLLNNCVYVLWLPIKH